MGEGISFACEHCGKENIALWGVGMFFLQSYKETIQQVKNGECGAEYQKLVERFPVYGINTEEYVFTCDRCNTWCCDKDMTFYVPKEKDSDLTYHETEDSSKKDYKYIREVNHRCPKCSRPMRRMSHNEAMNRLSTGWCGYCGAVNNTEDISYIMWD